MARAFWVTEPGTGAIRSETVGEPGPGEVRVRALYSGISRGSETLVFRGHVPEGEHERMRAPFQAGDFPAPVKYGYASVGVVEAGEPDLLGQTVFCLHPHQDTYVVPGEAVVPLPSEVPAARAVLAANAETAVNALWDGAPRVGDRVAVVGAGTVGCLCAAFLRAMPGVDVTLVDPDPAKQPAADALGVPLSHPADTPGKRDLIFHASGTAAGLQTALDAAGFEATVVELSWYGTEPVPTGLGGAFHSQRLQLVSSQVGSVSPARRARRTHRERLEMAIALLHDPALDALITGETRFADLPAAMARLAEQPSGVLCHRVVYGS
ncbi:Threonine dehydrogenase [Limimonas halophila]|uniref:Threonine dehydrogenase n=1 Tax=Limimonas halophila TaxID=1082479 RepID=A0A1G7NYP9_9PROT|nr:zinc-binding alcohol dehydrogenase [Limimonas halophila]SDF79114.1 Threonine dehydrogenase [Limimonas halophila]